MKNLLIYLVMLISSLTFAQSKNVKFDNYVSVKIDKNVVMIDIESYKGTIEISYRKVGDEKNVYFLSEYTNIKKFSEKHTLPNGKYTIEIVRDGKVKKSSFIVK